MGTLYLALLIEGLRNYTKEQAETPKFLSMIYTLGGRIGYPSLASFFLAYFLVYFLTYFFSSFLAPFFFGSSSTGFYFSISS